MYTEVATINVKPGTEDEFIASVQKAVPLFKNAKGCTSMELQRGVENPGRFRLLVGWKTLENHNVDFRQSPDFQAWRALVGHYFAGPPEVEHTTSVSKAF
ncbi:MAG: putative quinol monooxygenase [Burkholderiaceae bacterium]|nr:putative quinol monooxygenase [Burkholderiaceae bacterium]